MRVGSELVTGAAVSLKESGATPLLVSGAAVESLSGEGLSVSLGAAQVDLGAGLRLTRTADGLAREDLIWVRFVPLLPGQAPILPVNAPHGVLSNYSNYSKGINGIMIDIQYGDGCSALLAGSLTPSQVALTFEFI